MNTTIPDNRDPERLKTIVNEVLFHIDKHPGLTVREVFDAIGSVVATKLCFWPPDQCEQLLAYLFEVIQYNLKYFDETVKTKFN